jgi:PIN domain nuclease of toxin-antitoxin system
MRFLLDTHAFLWFMSGDSRLSRKALRTMESGANELILSAASVWEMAIKSRLGRLILPKPLEDYINEKREGGIQILPVDWTHASRTESLPDHHRDPFDRLLIAQSLVEHLPLVTADKTFHRYKGLKILW